MDVSESPESTETDCQWLVCSDLDGTLLDETYDWSPASEAVSALGAAGIPLILNSSKTLAEMKLLSGEICPEQPLVAENGGVVGLPSTPNASSAVVDTATEWVTINTGRTRRRILEVAHGLRSRLGYGFTGFADWSVEELVTHTGLTPSAAKLALDRHATEPILWRDTAERFESFGRQLAELDIRILRGGRFVHLMGAGDKAMGMARVVQEFQERAPGTSVKVLALGDAQNDEAMLQAAEIGIVIPERGGDYLLPEQSGIRHAHAPGPVGWNRAVLDWLNTL